MEKSSSCKQDHARLLSPDELDALDAESTELSPYPSGRGSTDSTSARLRDYEHPSGYGGRRTGGGGFVSNMMSRFSPKLVRQAMIGVGIALVMILAYSFLPKSSTRENIIHWVSGQSEVSTDGTLEWKKPEGFKIIGMVFYGRPVFVDILDCYLKKNLVSNGGWLDEVHFMENTKNEEDLIWLDTIMEHEPLYKKRKVGVGGAFDNIWQLAQEDNTMYIKVDDDIVYVHDDAVPRMVNTLLQHPEAHNVAANIVNSPLTNWLHYHTEAVHPFLPELQAPPPVNYTTWRPSELPAYPDKPTDEYNFKPQDDRGNGGAFEVGSEGGPPYEGHRWLPLTVSSNKTSEALMKTPIVRAEYAPFGLELYSWAIAAQLQYSLFKNLEDDTMYNYWTGNGDGIWNMQYTRYNLNFLAIWGESVAMKLPGSDDEEDLTVTAPKLFKRPCLIDTHAIVAHFNFGPQPELKHTDLLNRYRAYANEHVCANDNQKKELHHPYNVVKMPDDGQ